MADAISLISDALDHGDALVAALWDNDLARAEESLMARQDALDQLGTLGRPESVPPNLLARFSSQDTRIEATLSEHVQSSGLALASATRTSKAHGQYQSAADSPPVRFDTAPR